MLTKLGGGRIYSNKCREVISKVANMQNSARQAKDRALKILSQTEMYISDVNGKKLLFYFLDKLKDEISEVNRSIGEIDNILLQYGDTPEKDKMLELRNKLEDRECELRKIVDGDMKKF